MPGELPPAVVRFIERYINSVEQLEVLLLLRGAAEEVWTPELVGRELYTQVDSAARRLDDLASRRLVKNVEGGYRYEPASKELRDAVEELADVYARRRQRVIAQIFAEPGDAARSFSDAFRLRKDK